tara:strand:+ start:1080 stop:1463 length:384 start_codon:yes stop_codon:yes gene_type:complete
MGNTDIMAHFAELDDNNTVLRVLVLNDEDTADENGNEVESIGQQYLTDLFGGTWVQTSYNDNIRRRYAGIGSTYDPDLDIFINPKPFPSWVLDDDTQWQPPTPYPDDDKLYAWDEDTTSWVEITDNE